MSPRRFHWGRSMMISSSRCSPQSHNATIFPTRLIKIGSCGLIGSQCVPMKISIAIHDDQSTTKIGLSQRLHVSPGKPPIASLKTYFPHLLFYLIRWTPRPSHRRVAIAVRVSDVCGSATCPAQGKKRVGHSPTWRKTPEFASI